MTRFLLTLLFLALAAPAHAWEISLLGRTPAQIREANVLVLAAGAVTSLAVHELGHLVVMEIYNSDTDWNGLTAFHVNRIDESDSEMRNIARAGFVGQLLVGTALRVVAPESDFTAGYSLWAAGETWTYPLRRQGGGDLEMLKRNGGHADKEFAMYAAWAAGNLLTITW